MTTKKAITKKLARETRDARIRAVHASLPEATLQEIADMFHPCSVSSVWYAIHGREKYEEVAKG